MLEKPRDLIDLMSLEGRRALVTGAGGHIGPVVCETLLELGAEVIATDREHKRDRIPKGCTQVYTLDLLDLQLVRMAVPNWLKVWGDIDIFIHCAALTGQGAPGDGIREGWATKRWPDQTSEAFNYSLTLGLVAPFTIVKALADGLRRRGRGSVILFGSIYGHVAPNLNLYAGTPEPMGPIGYSATKGGVEQMTRHLAALLAPGCRVNCLVPGGILRGQSEEFRENYENMCPMGRMGTEEDLRGAVAFLASDMSAYMTGQVLNIDGGWGIW